VRGNLFDGKAYVICGASEQSGRRLADSRRLSVVSTLAKGESNQMTVPTCSKCDGKKFTYADQEFGEQVIRLIFCEVCGTVVGTTIPL
jgi:hypothetical protein